MNGLVVTLATVAIIAASAFFVAVEFSLMAAKRHRFEDLAPRSRAARAALRSSAELTILLAGAQLGITICTLALGAITKPAVHDALTPWLVATGLPLGVADVAAFVLALVVVTFLHLVVGEMAPKSWAIAHPERSAMLLALPMRAFIAVTRPFLRALNDAANALVRRAGAEPVDELTTGHDEAELRQLVAHSASAGLLEPSYRESIDAALELRELTLADLSRGFGRPTAVPESADVAQVQEATLRSGHLRVLLRRGGSFVGVVHVRDTLDLAPDAPVAPLARPAFELDPSRPLWEALTLMRRTRNHLALVVRGGEPLGVVTMSDILARLFSTPTREA